MHGSIVHGRRPGEVWFLLLCICMHRGLPFELARLIHKQVMCHGIERRACEIVLDRRDREKLARSKHGAESPTTFWRLLGFGSLEEFLAHKRWEMSQAEARKVSKLNASLPLWNAFGFETPFAYYHHLHQHLQHLPNV